MGESCYAAMLTKLVHYAWRCSRCDLGDCHKNWGLMKLTRLDTETHNRKVLGSVNALE